MTAWDAHPGEVPRIRRIRGGAAAEPTPRFRKTQVPVQQVIEERLVDRQPGLEIGRTGIDFDGVFAAALFTPMLFIGNLNTLGAAMIAALVPLYLFVRRERLLKTLGPRAFLYLAPGMALFSVIWSTATAESLRYGAEFAITVTAGLLLSSARNQEAVLRGIALAFLSYVAASVFFGGYVGVGADGAEAFAGLSDSKNLLGDIASTGAVVSLIVGIMALQRRRWIWAAGAIVAIGLDLYCVLGAHSAGAVLGLAMAILGICTLLPLVYAGKVVRAWATGMVALCLIAMGFFFQTLSALMMNLGATVFDKDSTLTGRTYLWYRASELIREHPALGRGFYAFWIQGNTDAEGLWAYFGIAGRGGFTFHNTFIEILVMLGWVGLVLIGGVVVTGSLFLIRKFVNRPTLPLVFWIGILLYELARTPIETIGVAPFYFSTALVFAALGAAFGRAHLKRDRPPRYAAAVAAVAPMPEPVRPEPGRRSLRLVKSEPEDEP